MSALSHTLCRAASCICDSRRPAPAWPGRQTSLLFSGQTEVFPRDVRTPPTFVLAGALSHRVPFRAFLYLTVILYRNHSSHSPFCLFVYITTWFLSPEWTQAVTGGDTRKSQGSGEGEKASKGWVNEWSAP